jgi:aryl-alcohol dehydrogenase-like predicted oxidoreductase
MEKRKLGNSDLMITPIAFGAWAIGGWMWGGAEKKDAIDALETSIDNGMTTIDTAPVYGFGLSEEIVGEVIKNKRDKVQLLTKYGLRWEQQKGEFYFSSKKNDGKPVDIYRYAAKDSVIKECEDSLKRLGTDYIDLYQIHWSDPTTPVEETMEAVNILLEQGKIRYAGVCNYNDALLAKAINYTNVISDQVPYSMVKRDIENDLVPLCKEKNIGILAYSPMQRGLLTGKFSPDHKFNEGDNRPDTPYFQPENIKRVNSFLGKIETLANDKNASLAQLVLRWTIEQPGITCALAGARNAEQVKDNLGALNFTLTDEEIKRINEELYELKLEF